MNKCGQTYPCEMSPTLRIQNMLPALYLLIFFMTNTDLQTNPNTNLIIRRASLFAFTLAAVGPYLPSNVLLPPSTHIHYIIVARVEISLKAHQFKSYVRACRLTKAKGPDSNHEGNRLGQH